MVKLKRVYLKLFLVEVPETVIKHKHTHKHTQINRATLKILYVRFEIDKMQRYVHHFIYLLNYSNKKVFKA